MRRNVSLDALKGLLIILVVLGHSLQYGFGPAYIEGAFYYDDYLFRSIYTFHVPLFMLISGCLFFHSNQRPFWSMIVSKFRYIGVPFVVYSTIIYVIWWKDMGFETFYFSDYLRKLQLNLWFLFSLLINCVIVGGITHIIPKTYKGYVLVMICICTMLISDESMMSMHKFAFPFFVLGYFLNGLYLKIMMYAQHTIFFVVMTVVFAGCVFTYDRGMMIYEGGYCVLHHGILNIEQVWRNMARFFICIISMVWFVSFFFVYMKRSSKMISSLAILGRYSLAIYGLQSVLFMVLSIILGRCHLEITHNYVSPLLICAMVLAICWGTILVLDRWKLGKILLLGKK